MNEEERPGEDAPAVEDEILVGLVRVREHCLFQWRKAHANAPRHTQLEEDHCPECILELKRQGYQVVRKPPRG
jgi:hypothetical protein